MQTLGLAALRGFHRLGRGLLVLLACVAVASVSFAAAGESKGSKDPGVAVVAAAIARVGDTYTWGATGPATWDCSGFTSTLWREVGGVGDIPRTSRQQQAWAVPLPAEQVLPGDLAFFGDPVTHVGIVKGRSMRAGGELVVHMVDASSSQHGVVERDVWKTGTIRYGRVPRRGMTPVRPWTPPAVVAPPAVVPSAVLPAVVATAQSASRPVVPRTASAVATRPRSGKTPLVGIPARQKVPSSALALKAVTLAKAALGNVRLTDVELVRNVWRRAGGTALPTTRAALTAAGAPVKLADLRVGDLIVYASPGSHVGIYVGDGLMVDASRVLGKVVLRTVWAAPGVHLVRLPA